jgi:hypothetical protein
MPPPFPPCLPEDGSRVRFRNVFLKKKHWTMDKVQKQDSSKCITPSSEPFRIGHKYYYYYCYWYLLQSALSTYATSITALAVSSFPIQSEKSRSQQLHLSHFILVSYTVLSAYREKIPARNAIYAHAQDFSASDELVLAILKAFIPQPLNKQRIIGFHVL